MTLWKWIGCSTSAPVRWVLSAGSTQISKVMACAALVNCLSTAVLAVTLDGPSGRIANATSDVPSFSTSNGGSTSPSATIDGDRSSAPGAFVEWANNGPSGFVVATFTYTLDAPYNIEKFELWNDRGQVDTGIEDFELVFFDISSSVVGTYAGTASQPNNTLGASPGESFSFAVVQNVSKIDLRVLSSFGVTNNQFREVEFSGTCCNPDVDSDGVIGLADYGIVLSCFSVPPVPPSGCVPADVNCDGVIDGLDAAIVLCHVSTPGNPACCQPAVTTQTPGVFCIDGFGNGSDWSWQIDANAPVTVTGPPSPSPMWFLRDAFMSSINLSSITGLAATSGPGATCFTVTYPAAFQFSVGPPGGPVTCLVSGNPTGCAFNPMIYEEAFFPVPLPGLTTLGAVIAALALALGALALVHRRRCAVGRAS